ncbi:MAG: hypothetical protein KGL39_10150 [Patescibacteria group bacterium]|nr:hypothetical protein [Patescibacteria group bacterium]
MSVNFAGIVPNNYPFNNRILFDANYITPNVALPGASAVNTNALNLLNSTPYPATETINVLAVIGVQGTANTTNSHNCNVYLQHTSANTDGTPNSTNWVNISTLGAVSAVDNAGGGWGAQVNALFKLPPGCQQFIRAQYSLEANSGNANSANGFLALVF